ncbi:hypothetical protein BZG35_01075 [Brevundimonas sp. LM2]|uniref:FAD:protein FMN transferase n=1 Tax=Brevundimonas sp. LM2 TaxID=1938605 RepID=UPI000983FC0D|nr:FAD:protein FMN transferase [Brevundimonas sp. LM2]AQR60403.1 hypothetical protein BZG35_01075 [Brevundimonas sp. LM2]
MTRPPSAMADGRIHRLAGQTMGTVWSIHVVLGPSDDPATVGRAAVSTLDHQVATFSHWDPTSELSRFNAAPPGRVPVSAELWAVIEPALALARETDGALDPALGALVDLWGFGPPGPRPADRRLPPDTEIMAARACGGWRRLEPDAATRSLRQPGGLRLDLSGIAKGHAVDRLSEALSAAGFDHHLVEIGGELRGQGVKPDGLPWWVEIESPPGAAGPRTLVALHGLALATSGDAERAFEAAGHRYGHTLDGRTGRPIDNGLAAVSVVADTARQADALATALTVMGPLAGPAWAEARGIAALFRVRSVAGPREIATAAARDMMDEPA